MREQGYASVNSAKIGPGNAGSTNAEELRVGKQLCTGELITIRIASYVPALID